MAWVTPERHRDQLLGDLDEEYRRFIRPSRSRVSADLWYWRQVLGTAPSLIRRRSTFLNGDLRRDLGQALRVLVRRPAFSLAVVGTLALGIGANTAVFSVVDAVVVRPLPFGNVDRVVRPLPHALFFLNATRASRLRERLSTVEDLAGWGRSLFLFDNGAEALEVRGATVDWNHFAMLGAQPMLGRTFIREDAQARDAVIITHGLWQRVFGGDPSVVGGSFQVSGRSMRLVGVMGPDHVPMETDWQAWRPQPLDPSQSSSALAVNLLLRPGVSVGEAESEFRAVWMQLLQEAQYEPDPEERAEMVVVPFRDWLLGDATASLLVILGAVSLILLLACVNVANLLLAHFGRRAQEFGIRAALGGGDGAVVRQILLEVGLLATVGGVLGLAFAWSALAALVGQFPADLPRAGGVGISSGVVLYGVLATGVTVAVAGVLPVLRARGDGAAASLASGGRTTTGGRARARIRALLVTAEVSFAVVLVVGAGLMVRSFTALNAVDPGFDAEGVVTVRPSPPSSRYPEPEDLIQYYERVTAELAAIPGVESVGSIQFLPMTSGGWWSSYRPDGQAFAEGQARPRMAVRLVTPGYLRTLGQRLLDGRDVTAKDVEGEEFGALVNETLAREAFGTTDAVGELLHMGGDEGARARVVGVVGDVRQTDLRTPTHPELYLPSAYTAWRRMHMVVRASGDPTALLRPVAVAVRRVDPGVHIDGPQLVTEVIGGTYAETRLVTTLLALFGLIALSVGGVGVYGVTAQAVSERTREIGVRIALGADRVGVARWTVLHGLVPVGVGLAAGLLIAWSSARLIESQLYGVGSRDPLTLVIGPLLLALVAVVATLLPALRASRVDPIEVLSQE